LPGETIVCAGSESTPPCRHCRRHRGFPRRILVARRVDRNPRPSLASRAHTARPMPRDPPVAGAAHPANSFGAIAPSLAVHPERLPAAPGMDASARLRLASVRSPDRRKGARRDPSPRRQTASGLCPQAVVGNTMAAVSQRRTFAGPERKPALSIARGWISSAAEDGLNVIAVRIEHKGGVVGRRAAFGRVAESRCAIVGTACPQSCRVEGVEFGAAPGRQSGVLLHAMRMEAVNPEVRIVVAERC
jgi:hypothetical protein